MSDKQTQPTKPTHTWNGKDVSKLTLQEAQSALRAIMDGLRRGTITVKPPVRSNLP